MCPSRAVRRQSGIGLIDVLVAMLVFSLGLLGLAALYVRAAPAPLQNMDAMAVQTAADSFMATLATETSSLPLNASSVTSSSGMPTTPLQQWFSQTVQNLPGLTVTVVSGNDALGNPCSTLSCGIVLTLGWTQFGSLRTQNFYGQIGIH